jgi:surface protein
MKKVQIAILMALASSSLIVGCNSGTPSQNSERSSSNVGAESLIKAGTGPEVVSSQPGVLKSNQTQAKIKVGKVYRIDKAFPFIPFDDIWKLKSVVTISDNSIINQHSYFFLKDGSYWGYNAHTKKFWKSKSSAWYVPKGQESNIGAAVNYGDGDYAGKTYLLTNNNELYTKFFYKGNQGYYVNNSPTTWGWGIAESEVGRIVATARYTTKENDKVTAVFLDNGKYLLRDVTTESGVATLGDPIQHNIKETWPQLEYKKQYVTRINAVDTTIENGHEMLHFFFNDGNYMKIYSDQKLNGGTVKCEDEEIGKRFYFNGKLYFVAANKERKGDIHIAIDVYDNICTTYVTDMKDLCMHNYCTVTSSHRKLDLTDWDTSNVTTMENMFANSEFNQDISSWDTSNVTNMSRMFQGAKSFNQKIGDWKTNNVLDMSFMFSGATSFNQDISSWNTSNVTNMSRMFEGAKSFDQPIGKWHTSKVTNMSHMFSGGLSENSEYLSSNFNQDISGWNTSNVTDMNSMFKRAKFFNQKIGGWKTNNVLDMSFMFTGAESFNSYIGDWDTSSVTNMSWMFQGATSFNQNISGWNVSNVKTYYEFGLEDSNPDYLPKFIKSNIF